MNREREIVFREEVRPGDEQAVKEIVTSTGFFRPDEIDVAVELVDERLAKGLASGYYFVFAEMEGRVVAYTCYGPIAATEGSYDLYWIATHHDFRGQGVGKILLQKTEEAIARLGGRRIYIETSSTDLYVPTRAFYLRCGYTQEALLADFYRPGDGKVIYGKAV